VSLWNAANFLGCAIPRSEWVKSEGDFNHAAYCRWVRTLAARFIERHALNGVTASVVKRDAELRIKMAQKEWPGFLRRSCDVAGVAALLARGASSDQLRSAARYVGGASGYGAGKAVMQYVHRLRSRSSTRK
jgi:hypothetical protein